MLFEKATKHKLRFTTARGLMTTEDLWDMPLLMPGGFCLNQVAKDIHRKLKDTEKSFVTEDTPEDTILTLKFEVVKHIIAVKLEEQKASELTLLAKAKKDKILAIIADKADESLRETSLEDLKKMLDEL